MVVTGSTHRKVSQTDAAEIASHKGGRIGICEACGYGNDMFPETSEPVRDADILKGLLGKPKN